MVIYSINHTFYVLVTAEVNEPRQHVIYFLYVSDIVVYIGVIRVYIKPLFKYLNFDLSHANLGLKRDISVIYY